MFINKNTQIFNLQLDIYYRVDESMKEKIKSKKSDGESEEHPLFIKAIESNTLKFKSKIGFLNKTAQSIDEELCATTNFEFFIKFKV